MKPTERGDVMEIHVRHVFCVILTSCINQTTMFDGIEPLPIGNDVLFLKSLSLFNRK